MARHLPLGEMGAVTLLLALHAIASVLCDGGQSLLLADTLARHGASGRAAFRVVARRRVGLSLLGSLFVAAAFSAVSRPLVLPLAWFAASLVATSVYTTAAVVLRDRGLAWVEAANEPLSRVIVLGLGSWLLARGGGVSQVAAAYATGDICSALGLGLVASRAVRADTAALPHDAAGWRRASALGFAAGLALIYYRVDTWLVAALLTGTEVARYATAYRVFEVLGLPAGAVASMTVPWVRKLPDELGRARLARLTAAAIVVSALLAVVGLVTAPWLIRILFGAGYRASVTPLRLLLAGLPATAAATVLLPYVVVKRPSLVVGLYWGLLAANVGLNLILLPVAGIAGAAVATGLCQVVAAWVLARCRRRA